MSEMNESVKGGNVGASLALVREAVQKIKDQCAGEAMPRWENGPRTTGSRGYILDLCDAALGNIPPHAAGLSALTPISTGGVGVTDGVDVYWIKEAHSRLRELNGADDACVQNLARLVRTASAPANAVPDGWQLVPKVVVDSVEEVWRLSLVISSGLRSAPSPEHEHEIHAALRMVKDAHIALAAPPRSEAHIHTGECVDGDTLVCGYHGQPRSEVGAEPVATALAQWMLDHSFATGHGDTHADLLRELSWQIAELRGKSALAEPVAWMFVDGDDIEFSYGHDQFSSGRTGGTPLYTHPPTAAPADDALEVLRAACRNAKVRDDGTLADLADRIRNCWEDDRVAYSMERRMREELQAEQASDAPVAKE